jgi:sigma-B regulation protein RsbU (phosphoserine phosphatase)
MSRIQVLRGKFTALTRVDKFFLIVLVLRCAYFLLSFAIPQLPFAGFVRALFVVAEILFLVRSFPRILRSLLWRVRHRLVVTWVLVGVVPIVLIGALVAEGFYMLMGQGVGYMTTTEILRRSNSVRDDAESLAWSLTHRENSINPASVTQTFITELSDRKKIQVSAVVRIADNQFAVPSDAPIQEIPRWSRRHFLGLIRGNDGYYLGSDVLSGEPPQKAEVFLYQTTPPEFFSSLLPGVATIVPDQESARAGGIDIRRSEKKRSGISFNASRPDVNPDPQLPQAQPPGTSRGLWDIAVHWAVLTPSTNLTSGTTEESLAIVAWRPSLILDKLFSTLGNVISTVVLVLLIATALCFLIVEIVSVIFGIKLTRSITRAVSDLYLGTKKVQTGDFSHRIPIRSKDQLSELAGSFNNMTERIENLIVEVKEKERLENELEIAREVQARLFPISSRVSPSKTLSSTTRRSAGLIAASRFRTSSISSSECSLGRAPGRSVDTHRIL